MKQTKVYIYRHISYIYIYIYFLFVCVCVINFYSIYICTKFQRHHFELELLDGNFLIPSQPYLYMQHQTWLEGMRKDDSVFRPRMREFVKGMLQ